MKNRVAHIIKASGKVEDFSIEKLEKSLKKSGADDKTVEEIAKEVSTHLFDGMTTRKIYQLAFRLLNKRKSKPIAAKYSIKRAIMDLGPSGFPFEKYVSLLFEHLGFKVRINQFMNGLCVDHEVDIIAEDETKICITECKYHNQQGAVSDIKVPLYVNSRFRDITANLVSGSKEHQCWIVTNTRFSTDSQRYGNCSGLHLLSWDYPGKNSLRELIGRFNLYPISCLTSLTNREKQLLLNEGIILCSDLVKSGKILGTYNISEPRISNIIKEAMILAGLS